MTFIRTDENESNRGSEACLLNVREKESEVRFLDAFAAFVVRLDLRPQAVRGVAKVCIQREHRQGDHVRPENLKKLIRFSFTCRYYFLM